MEKIEENLKYISERDIIIQNLNNKLNKYLDQNRIEIYNIQINDYKNEINKLKTYLSQKDI